MKRKYILTKKFKEFFGIKLFQIKAVANFENVKKGELGGWIEKESNLSQEGNAWVYGNALVYGNARVYGDAWVYGNARVYGNVWVSGKLKLDIGFYFGIQFKNEKIKKLKTEDGNYILWKE